MIYLIPSNTDKIKDMSKESIGVIRTPTGGSAWGIENGYKWAADSGAFTGKLEFNLYIKYLERMSPYLDTCLFATVPDVLCNPITTMFYYRYYAWRIKVIGYPVAFVAQDGQEEHQLPPEYDWLFIGGSTAWKLSSGADDCIFRAKNSGKRVHIGRVNSKKRIQHFMLVGADSADGTHWKFEPDKAKERIPRWLVQEPLFKLEG